MTRWSPEKTRPSLFWPLSAIVVPLVGYFAKVSIRGEENLPLRGAYVLSPNHTSEFDPLIVAIGVWRMGRAPRFMAKESLFRVPVLGWALKRSGMVPVARASSASAAKQTMQQSKTLVEHGRGVIVYPEGTLTREPNLWPMRGKSGAVRLALSGDIPLIPVAHWGVQEIMPRYGKGLRFWPPRKRVEMLVGPPVDLSDLKPRAGEPQALLEATERLMSAITVLVEELRHEKAPAGRWDPAAHGQSETGRLDS